MPSGVYEGSVIVGTHKCVNNSNSCVTGDYTKFLKVRFVRHPRFRSNPKQWALKPNSSLTFRRGRHFLRATFRRSPPLSTAPMPGRRSLVVYAARLLLRVIANAIASKINRPSPLPSRTSLARSGCGISPKTLRSGLQIPAMLSIDPLGLESA